MNDTSVALMEVKKFFFVWAIEKLGRVTMWSPLVHVRRCAYIVVQGKISWLKVCVFDILEYL